MSTPPPDPAPAPHTDLDTRPCVITGGGSGIGRAIALLLARQGRPVALVALPRDQADTETVVADVHRAGGRALAIAADITHEADVVRAFDEAQTALGPPSGLVNSAGVLLRSRVADFSRDQLLWLLGVNVLGTMMCCREAARRMSLATGGAGGAIVNLSSMAATIGGRPGGSAYAASKAAVDCFTTGFAREVAREGIRVNVIRPGLVTTPMTAEIQADALRRQQLEETIPMGRFGRPEEIAELASWLLSSRASLVTGAHINAGGGGFHVGGYVSSPRA